VFGTDLDTCADFYEYILRRLEKILTKYSDTGARFVTWFTVVLRNRYLNYLRERKTQNRGEDQIKCISFDFHSENGPSLYDIIGDNRSYDQSRFQEIIEGIVQSLKDKQRVFFHLYYIETLRPEDIGFISVYLGRHIRRLLSGINMIRNSMVEKYRIRNRLSKKLSDLYYELLKHQKEGDITAAERIKKKRENVLEEYRRVKLNPSYETIARFLEYPIGTVSTGIKRMKSAVKSYLKEHFHE
jgi:RNA polymerase sigma factor (sigma-70 family)